MTSRQVFVVLGIVILIGSFMFSKYLGSLKQAPPQTPNQVTSRIVRVTEVNNADLNPETPFLGVVKAKQRVELFAEVNGISRGSFDFREGSRFRKGEVLIAIDDEETRMNLLAQKTSFLNQIANALPDFQLDYKDNYKKWEDYVNTFDESKPLKELPAPSSDKEKRFIAAKNLSNQYYTIKAQEARLEKYTLVAPFDGIVSGGILAKGSLVRAGQKLGDLLSNELFEVEGSIRLKDLGFANTGDSVVFTTSDGSYRWIGVLTRVSDYIDASTQTVNVYASIKGDNLYDGMYLNAVIYSGKVDDCVRIERKLLLGDTAIFVLPDSTLQLQNVQVIKYSEENVLVRGIPDGTKILAEPVNNGYRGMPVKEEK
jgi:RND family efflux transporter MFP subunit